MQFTQLNATLPLDSALSVCQPEATFSGVEPNGVKKLEPLIASELP